MNLSNGAANLDLAFFNQNANKTTNIGSTTLDQTKNNGGRVGHTEHRPADQNIEVDSQHTL